MVGGYDCGDEFTHTANWTQYTEIGYMSNISGWHTPSANSLISSLAECPLNKFLTNYKTVKIYMYIPDTWCVVICVYLSVFLSVCAKAIK